MEAGAVERKGRTLAIAKYQVRGEIGHGGMATVYRALDPRLGREVALKVIHPHLRDSQEVKRRFFVEAQAVAKLRHANIVEVYDVADEDEEEQYLVVELVEGVTLRKLLRDRSALPPEIAAALGLELLAAIAHAHAAGVVHRDVKPENVMIEHHALKPDRSSNDPEPPGTRVSVKLTDFGIAKLLDAQGVTSTGQVLGSPAHMAPEQIEGGDVDGRADIFGLGVLLYEAMVGRLPFDGTNPAQVLRRVLDGTYTQADRLAPAVGKRWSAILDKALAQKPEQRYASAPQMRDAITAELVRLDPTPSRVLLERWLDDPVECEAARTKPLIDRLCVCASAARARGDFLSAAADYNRALAYAPDDPQLLRAVATMSRARTRGVVARRAAIGAGGALVLLGASAFAWRASRHASGEVPTPTDPTFEPAAIDPHPEVPSSPVAIERPPVATRAAAAVSRTGAPSVAFAAPRGSGSAHGSNVRDVVIATVRPPFGVFVRVDEGALAEVTGGQRITLDDKAHAFRFSCVNDACEPLERAIAGSDRDELIDVAMSIRGATLVIDGDTSRSYQLAEEPSLVARPGTSIRIPMRGAKYPVHVVEVGTGRVRDITLTAGRETRVSFTESP